MAGRGRRVGMFAVSALTILVLLVGCNPFPSGIVQDKRESAGALGLTVFEVCLGESKQTCTWHQVTGKFRGRAYDRCEIGERYPDCRTSRKDDVR